MLKPILMTVGMIVIGIVVWRLIRLQGHATPPTDDHDSPGAPKR